MPTPSELHGLLEQVRELNEEISRLEAENASLKQKFTEQEAQIALLLADAESFNRQLERANR